MKKLIETEFPSFVFSLFPKAAFGFFLLKINNTGNIELTTKAFSDQVSRAAHGL